MTEIPHSKTVQVEGWPSIFLIRSVWTEIVLRAGYQMQLKIAFYHILNNNV